MILGAVFAFSTDLLTFNLTKYDKFGIVYLYEKLFIQPNDIMSAGKGDGLRKGANLERYRANHARIFNPRKEAEKITNDRARPAKKGSKIKSEDCKEADNN